MAKRKEEEEKRSRREEYILISLGYGGRVGFATGRVYPVSRQSGRVRTADPGI